MLQKLTGIAAWVGGVHIMLQQKYKNEHDNRFTYIGPLGPISLTGPMILGWAHILKVV